MQEKDEVPLGRQVPWFLHGFMMQISSNLSVVDTLAEVVMVLEIGVVVVVCEGVTVVDGHSPQNSGHTFLPKSSSQGLSKSAQSSGTIWSTHVLGSGSWSHS